MTSRKRITWPLVYAQMIVVGVVLVMSAGMTWGHNGALSQSDGCHNDKKAGERHCHAAPMTFQDGTCTITIKVPEEVRELTPKCVEWIEYLDGLWSNELYANDVDDMVSVCLGE